jgi:hypothetical protein
MSDVTIIPDVARSQEMGAGVLPARGRYYTPTEQVQIGVNFVLINVCHHARDLTLADVESIIQDLRAAYQTGLLLTHRAKRKIKPDRFKKPYRFKLKRS